MLDCFGALMSGLFMSGNVPYEAFTEMINNVSKSVNFSRFIH